MSTTQVSYRRSSDLAFVENAFLDKHLPGPVLWMCSLIDMIYILPVKWKHKNYIGVCLEFWPLYITHVIIWLMYYVNFS